VIDNKTVPSELHWVDAPRPELIRLAWPIVVSMLSASVMTLVDTLMVSGLGSAALSGVGLGGILSFILICFPIGVLGAVKILSSQAFGAGRIDAASAYLGAGLGLGIFFATVSYAAARLALPFLPEVTASAASADAAQTYLGLVAIAAFPNLIRIAIEQTRLAIGDSQSPMRVSLLANICNVALNYLFIIVLERGVRGAAEATVIASVVGAVAMIAVQLNDRFDLGDTRLHHVAAVWRLGLPSGLQFAMEMGSFATMVVLLTRLSDLDGAANQIAIQVLHFGFLPCMALGEAASIMAGQAVGAARRDLVLHITRHALIAVVAYASLATAIFVIAGEFIAMAFTQEPELIQLATRLLYVAAAFQIADGVNILARSVLRGTGDVRFCAWVGIFFAWIMTPPLTLLLGYHYGLGALGGWLGLTLEIYLTAVIFWRRLQGGGWHASADATLRELGEQAESLRPSTVPRDAEV
jgi:MATE family multidrug resistance protein